MTQQKPPANVLVLSDEAQRPVCVALLQALSPTASRVQLRLELPREAALSLSLLEAPYETSQRSCTLLSLDSPQDALALLTAAPSVDYALHGALLVVSEVGLDPALAPSLHLVATLSLALIVFLELPSESSLEQADAVESALRVSLSALGLAGDEALILRGGAARGVVTDDEHRLMRDAFDERLPLLYGRGGRLTLSGLSAGSLRQLKVEATTDRPLRGEPPRPGETLELLGVLAGRAAQCLSCDERSEPLARRRTFLLSLQGVTPQELQLGQTLARPGTASLQSCFRAALYFLPSEHRFRWRAGEWLFGFSGGFAVSGHVKPRGQERVRAGEHATAEIELSTPLSLEEGQGFSVLREGKLCGLGVIQRLYQPRQPRRGWRSPVGVAMAFVDALNRRERPESIAGLLFPPEELVRQAVPEFWENVLPHIQSGRILRRLLSNERSSAGSFGYFTKERLSEKEAYLEYLGLLPYREGRGRRETLARGSAFSVYSRRYSERREFKLQQSISILKIRAHLRSTTRRGEEELLVGMNVASFEAQQDKWFLFDLETPSDFEL